MRPQLRQLLKFILEFFQILIIMPLLITVCVLEQICVLVEVVLRKQAFCLYLVVVCLCSHLLQWFLLATLGNWIVPLQHLNMLIHFIAENIALG